MQDFKKVCHIGCSINGEIYVEIEYKNGELHIEGVEGPLSNGNCRGSCGQIQKSIAKIKFKDWDFGTRWNKETVDKLIQIWDRWHLNHMNPGTPAQMIILKHFQKLANEEDDLHKELPNSYAHKKGFDSYYTMELSWLKSVDMEYHNGYKFGTRWLCEEVPTNILEWLYNLPEASQKPKWFN